MGKVGVAVSPAQPGARLRLRRGEARRPLPQRRRRREVHARQRRAQDPRARLVLLLDLRRTRRTPTLVYLPNVQMHKSIDGGKTFANMPRAARRQPRPVDRPGRPGAHDPRQRRRRRRSRTTAARAGRPRTTSRRRSSTASRPTTSFPTGSTARSRTTRTSRSRAASRAESIGLTDWHPAGGGESGWMAVDPARPQHRLRRRVRRDHHALRPPHEAGARSSWRGRSSPTATRRRT